MEPDLAARMRLGEEVKAARSRAGYADTAEWSKLVGRTPRTLLGLERGEKQGRKTYEAVAKVLGWSNDKIFGILAGDPLVTGPIELTDVSDEVLAAEVLRRMRMGGDGDVDRDAASMKAELRAVASKGDQGDAAAVDKRAAAQRRSQTGASRRSEGEESGRRD